MNDNESKQVRQLIRSISNLAEARESLQKIAAIIHGYTGETQALFYTEGLHEELLMTILNSLSVEWLKAVVSVDELFMIGCPHVSFVILHSGLSSKYNTFIAGECLRLLDHWLAEGQHVKALIQCCHTELSPDERQNLVKCFASLPEQCANRFHREVPQSLQTDCYIKALSESIVSALLEIKDCLTKNQATSLKLVAELVGKLCLCGYAKQMWDIIISKLFIRKDFLLSRVFHRLFVGIPDRAMEAALLPLLSIVDSPEDIVTLLGNSILENQKLQLLLTEKVLLHKYFTNDSAAVVLRNVIGYLVSSPTRSHLYQRVYLNLFKVWSDSSSLRHVSFQQHFYISKAIIVCTSHLTDSIRTEIQADLMKLLMNGLQHHLGSSDPSIRRTGMAVAEILSDKLVPSAEQKLKFEYDDQEELTTLRELLRPCNKPPLTVTLHNKQEIAVNEKTMETQQAEQHEKKTPNVDVLSDLDSDDELEPMSSVEDKPRSKLSPPAYLRDCMHGLMDAEKPAYVELCLQAVPSLVKRNVDSVYEVAVEFAKILLHLGDESSIEGFIPLRHKAMVSLLVTCPQLVAEYFTEQFFERNYNIRQRLDILEALSSAATELANPKTESQEKIQMVTDDTKALNSDSSADWRSVVEKRIANKTRRFAHATKKPPASTPSKFAHVAGHFFFPLLQKVDCPTDGSFELMGSDSMVLVQFIHALGTILGAAQHAPVLPKMAACMFQFLWAIRYHSNIAVRRTIIFALAMTVMALSPRQLVSDFSQDVTETQEWLVSVVEKEADTGCQELAAWTVKFLASQIKEGFDHSNE